MNAGWVKWVVGLGLAVGGVAVASSSDVVLDALLQRPADDHGTVVVPDRFVRSWDPVTVFFDGNPGPADGGPADHADALVKLAPNHPGAWTWLDGHTLQFRPAEPWAPLATVTVRTGGKTTVLSTLASPPIASTPPNGADGLSAVDTVTLVFAEPIDVATLAKMTLIELRPLPGIGNGPATRLRSDAFEVKPLDRASEDDPAAYTLVLREPLPPGQRVVVRVTLSQDEAADDAIAEVVFRTAEPFRPVTFGCDGATLPVSPGGTVHPAERPIACTGARSVRVGFTSALGAVSPVLGRNLVRFEPAVDGLSFTASGRELVVRGAFRSEVPYRVALAPTPVVDAAGRTLDITGESVVWLYFPRRDPYLRWGVGQGVAEQHGPKRIPVEGRGIDDADVRVYRVDPLNRALWPFPSDPIAIDESARPPGPGEEPGGWDDPDPISTDELAQRLRSLGSPGWSGIVHLPDASDDAARFGLDLAPALARVSGKDAPGHYLVGLRRLDGTTERTWVRLQVTDLALTTVENPADVLFQVSSLASGGPVAGAVVTVEAREDT
ncbi:MAG: Ig-like domain-containing protein, partial [Myxococcota bacterium]